MTSILSEYLGFLHKYSEKYGDKVAVLMQVGSFYEMYGVNNDTEKIGNAEELSRILNIVLTKRNKKIRENGINNPLMLGFPCLALNKYVPILLENNYTVVIVDQTKTPFNIKRAVVDIISPSINLNGSDSCYLVLIYVDKHKHVGISAINVITGNNVVHEYYSDVSDPEKSLDETLGFLKQYRPKEVVLCAEGLPPASIISHLELNDVLCHITESKKPNVEQQNAILGIAFENNSMLSNIEYLEMERMPYALLSYVLLIEFVYDHNPILLRRMSFPEQGFVNRLVLSTSTIDQLNIAGNDKHTLLGVINKCSTNAGRRLLTKRILAPAVDEAEIERRYCQIDEFSILFGDDVQSVDKLLKKVVDIERLQRRMSMGIITPSELASLVMSYEGIICLDDLLKTKTCSNSNGHLAQIVMDGDSRQDLEWFIGMCRYMFDVDKMLGSDVVLNIGVCKTLDELRQSIQHEMDIICEFAINIGIDNPKVEHSNNIGYCIVVTSAQARAVKGIRNIEIKSSSSLSRITSPKIEAAGKRIGHMSESANTCTRRVYKATLKRLLHYTDVFDDVVSFVSVIDVVKSNFCTGKKYGYCRPTIGSGKCSFADAKGLRHPIIERIDDGKVYVPNDISIGKHSNGIILYSMNSCGKTSLLRAIGIAIILAQAGCFVPASSFIFRPFKCMMTRILSRDNIMKGQSSFVAEMVELKAILKRASDSSAIVLADEITHGTEHTSGSSIFVSAVETLAKKRANFLFTTHLHGAYPFIKNVPNVQVLHLSVAFENGKIVFERKLKNGPGGSIYGLEVCNLIGMDDSFLARAFQIRAMITPDKHDNTIKAKPKPSRYNSKKMVQQCEICGYSPRLPTDSPLDTHHIRHQSYADENDMIQGVHKDALSNLKVLCKNCHAREHT